MILSILLSTKTTTKKFYVGNRPAILLGDTDNVDAVDARIGGSTNRTRPGEMNCK